MDEVKGKRLEGWLLKDPVPRITPKSPYLKKLERMQNPTPPVPPNVTQLKAGKRKA